MKIFHPTWRANIRTMYFIKLVFNMHFIAAVLVPFYTDWGGIRFSQILFLNAAFMFFIFLLEVPTGTIADFFGRKISMTLACVVNIAGTLLYISYPDFYVFLTAEFIWAVALTLMSGANEAFVYDSLIELGRTEMSKKIFSRMESFKLSGILSGALLGGVIAKFGGLRAPFLMMTIPFGIAGLLTLSLKEPDRHQPREKASYKALLLNGLRFFAGSKILRILTLDMVIVLALSWLIIWFYQAILLKVGVDIVWFGGVHSLMCVTQIIIIQNSGTLERLLRGKKRLLFWGAFLSGAGLILLGAVEYVPIIIFAILLTAGFGLSRTPLFTSYLNKFIPSDKRATVLSVTSMFSTLGRAGVSILAGLLADGSLQNTLIIAGSLLIVFSFISRVREEHLVD